ncbi:hypothetical protein ABDB91_17545 [Desulfoscipio sp. XC116]|uniref:hypothetical protein n=1 Tax=Desulfoscipio sp. XC116 TaxID=3144975 RepID=UPI00325A7596
MEQKSLINIEHSITKAITGDKDRQALVNKVIIKTIMEENNEEKAFTMFLWHLADIDPPISFSELLVFKAIYRMFNSYCDFLIKDKQQAMDILDIPRETLQLPPDELTKQAKISYWHHFNELSGDIHTFLTNAQKIGVMKKALNFLCRQTVA